MTTVFWIDHEHDRGAASDGVSRYGFYLRDRRDWFEDCLDSGEPHTARFAATAWRIATGPVMSPGYVRCHRRVLRHDVERNDWDGSLMAYVDLITGWPQALDRDRTRWHGEGWRDWPTEHRFASSDYAYVEPSGEDLVKAPYLLASASFRFAVPVQHLPMPATAPARTGTGLLPAAKEAVQAVVTELNQVIGPVVEALERS